MGTTTQEVFASTRAARPDVLAATGEWVAGLAPWTDFLTLTHRLPGDRPPSLDPRPVVNAPTYSRVGVQRHRRMTRKFFYDVVRKYDPGARWWSEMEFHHSGVPHEHVLLALESPRAPRLSMRQWWYEQCGYAVFERVRGSAVAPAEYVAKYTEKGGAYPPLVLGFGLSGEPSFAQTFAAVGAEERRP